MGGPPRALVFSAFERDFVHCGKKNLDFNGYGSTSLKFQYWCRGRAETGGLQVPGKPELQGMTLKTIIKQNIIRENQSRIKRIKPTNSSNK